jgi:hypothetical protein
VSTGGGGCIIANVEKGNTLLQLLGLPGQLLAGGGQLFTGTGILLSGF